MKARSECFICLLKQAHATAKIAGKNEEETKGVVLSVASILHSLDPEGAPPLLAVEVYERIGEMLNESDPYAAIKAHSIKIAREMVARLGEIPEELSPCERLAMALKIAVLGNVIDYGAQESFCVQEESKTLFETPWAKEAIALFYEQLLGAKRIVYLGDNAGENIFDRVLLGEMKRLNPQASIHYFTRGRAIINDLTYEEAKGCEMESLCTLVDSGVPSPGFIYALATKEAQGLYDEADLILSKGMGNFEVLEDSKDPRLFMLFKVKCEVVAKHLGIPLGGLVFAHSPSIF